MVHIIDIGRLENLETKLKTLSIELAWAVAIEVEEQAKSAEKKLKNETKKLDTAETKVHFTFS